MHNKFVFLLLFFSLFFLLHSKAWAANYYVSTSGNDSNNGSQTTPWKTIQKAANSVVAGDTVTVMAGDYHNATYTDARISLTHSGTVSSPIVFQAQGTVKMTGFTISADYVTVKGFEIINLADQSSFGILVDRSSYCRIENNYIHACTWGGITFTASSTEPARTNHCTVINNKLFRNGMHGIDVRGDSHLIENNEIWGTIQHHPCNVSSATVGWLDADFFHFHGSGHIFRGNYMHDIWYGGSGWTQGTCDLASIENLNNDFNDAPHIDCFQTFDDLAKGGSGKNITFERNLCVNYDNNSVAQVAGKFIEEAGPSQNLTIKNNVAKVYMGSRFVDGSNIYFYNNTIVGVPNAVGIYLTNTNNTFIQNNVLAYQENGIGTIWPEDSISSSTLTAGNNCVYRAGGAPWRSADPGDVWNKNPLFVNESTLDFHLQPTSPCINKGLTIAGVTNDFDGVVRPQGAAYDIGAFEYTANLPSPSPSSVPSPSPSPTPACKADLNKDKTVNLADIVAVLSKWGQTGTLAEDINGDGIVNLGDLQNVLSLWGQGCN